MGRFWTMAYAMCRDAFSSPSRYIRSASSFSEYWLTMSDAVGPSAMLNRMSKGSGLRNEKPLVSRSSCREDIPKSKSMPWTGIKSNRFAIALISAKFSFITSAALPYVLSLSLATVTASGSASIISTCPPGDDASSIARECPPSPAVASMYLPPGCTLSAARVSFNITGWWMSLRSVIGECRYLTAEPRYGSRFFALNQTMV